MAPYNTMPHSEKTALLACNSPPTCGTSHSRMFDTSTCRVLETRKVQTRRKFGFLLAVGLLFMFAVFNNKRIRRWGHQLPRLWSNVDFETPSSMCPTATIPYGDDKLVFDFDFSGDDSPDAFFLNQELTQKLGWHSVNTNGQIIVQAAESDATSDVSVDIDIKLSHRDLADFVHVRKSSNGVTIETEQTTSRTLLGAQPCILIIARVFVSLSVNMSAFKIQSTQLSTLFDESLNLAADTVVVHTHSGSVEVKSTDLNSREVKVTTMSGTIKGSYPLADLLLLKSISGSIRVNVSPKEADSRKKHDGTASFVAESMSGSVNAVFDTASVPDRAYNSVVSTMSGSVSGTYLLGTSTSVQTASGTVRGDFITAGTQQNRTLVVGTTSSDIDVSVLESDFKLGTLGSRFHSISGGVDIAVPTSWEGTFEGHTTSGSIKISGDGVEIIKDDGMLRVGRNVVARKGDGYSILAADTVSGSIKVTVG